MIGKIYKNSSRRNNHCIWPKVWGHLTMCVLSPNYCLKVESTHFICAAAFSIPEMSSIFLYSVLSHSVLLVLFSDFICSVVGSPLSLLESQLPLVWITMGAEMMPLSEYMLSVSLPLPMWFVIRIISSKH